MARLAGGMVGVTLLYTRPQPDLVLLFQLALDQFRAEGRMILSARVEPGAARLRLENAVIQITVQAAPVPLADLAGLWRPMEGLGAPDMTGLRLAQATARHRSVLVLTLSSRDAFDRERGRRDLIALAQLLVALWEPAEPTSALILHPEMRLLAARELCAPGFDPDARPQAARPVALHAPQRATKPAARLPALIPQRPLRPRHRLSVRSAGRLFRHPDEALKPPLPQLDLPARTVAHALRSSTAPPARREAAVIRFARLAVVALWVALVPASGEVLALLAQTG